MSKKRILKASAALLLLSVYVFFLKAGSLPAKGIGENFLTFAIYMLRILPPVFILIGLFDVWVKEETVEKHLGRNSGIAAYLWATLLASAMAGGLFVAFPVAHSLYRKGARLSVIFTYIGAAGICRIPMTTFEAYFMGIKFTLIRLMVSIPLVIIVSILMERYLQKTGYTMNLLADK
ncbi:permease [bacterium]|nr:permease [bacterium]